MRKVAVIVLGCPKNTVEAEYLLGILQKEGFAICPKAEDADAVIIHTCSFIRDARVESENCIKNVLSLKKSKDVKVYVSGCLPQLLKEEIIKQFPLIDAYIGTGALEKLPVLLLNGEVKGDLLKPGGLNDSKYRILSSGMPSAYLKIAEGCNHKCSFCIIPDLRGKFTSRTVESLYSEAKSLAGAGIRELILIAQDTTTYGLDIYDAFSLDKLLSKIAKIKELRWIRLMYAYPSSITDSLLDVFKEYKNICGYMDIPIQHVSKNVLSLMKRPSNTKEIIEKIKNKLPDMALRTSIITGFPGETGDDAQELTDFIGRGYFTYAGVFEYSDQKEAQSSKLKNKVSAKTAKARMISIEKAQYKVFESKIKLLKGSKTEFFAESCVKQGRKYLITGRSSFQAPEIDGSMSVLSGRILEPGKFYDVIIKDNEGYNIKAEVAV